MKNWFVKNRLALVLFLVGMLIYGGALKHDYAWDDQIVIQNNERVQQGISGIPLHFKRYTSLELQNVYGYRPVTLTTFGLDYQFFPDNPGWAHFVNLLLFGLLCAVIFGALRVVFQDRSEWLAFWIALLFALHPLHVEVVANIKSRDEILGMLFGMLALRSFFHHFDSRKWWSLALSLFLLVLAFFSKESSGIFLPIIFLSALIFRRENWKKYVFSFAPLLLPLVVFGLVSFYLLSNPVESFVEGSETQAEVFLENQLLSNSVRQGDEFGDRIANSLVIELYYLKNFFAPFKQLYFYGYQQIPFASGFSLLLLFSFLLHLAMLGAGLFLFRKRPVVSFGLLFYLGTIFPYLHILFFLPDTMADRYAFTPSLGLCILLVGVIAWMLGLDLKKRPVLPFLTPASEKELKKKRKRSTQKIPFAKRWLPEILLAGFGIMLLVFTLIRVPDWKNNLTLFSADIPYMEDCSKCHFHYAEELMANYGNEVAGTPENQEKIIHHYQRSVEISSYAYYSYLGLSQSSNLFGRSKAAIPYLEQAVIEFNLQGDMWFYLGQAYFFDGQYAKAATALETSKELNPYPEETWKLLALSYSRAQIFGPAELTLREAIKKFPKSDDLQLVWSEFLFESGNVEASFSTLKTMTQRNPMNPVPWRTMIGRYQAIGNDSLAGIWYQRALNRGVPL